MEQKITNAILNGELALLVEIVKSIKDPKDLSALLATIEPYSQKIQRDEERIFRDYLIGKDPLYNFLQQLKDKEEDFGKILFAKGSLDLQKLAELLNNLEDKKEMVSDEEYVNKISQSIQASENPQKRMEEIFLQILKEFKELIEFYKTFTKNSLQNKNK